MDEITSSLQLEAWLKDKPKEWAQVLALRCSLRLVPILSRSVQAQHVDERLKERASISTFRAFLISWVSANKLDALTRDAASSALKYANRTSKLANQTKDFSISYICNIAANVILSSIIKADLDAAVDNIYLTTNNKLVEDYTLSLDAALKSDFTWLQSNQHIKNCHQELLSQNLWPRRKNSLGKEWELLKSLLLKQSPGWQFWTDWYQSIRDGTLHPGLAKDEQDALYYEIAGYSDELWKEGATAINAQIVKSLHDIKTPAEVSFLQASYVDGKYLGVSANNKTIDLERKSKPANYKTEQFRTLVNSPEFRSNVERNKTAISFACAGVIVQVEEYKKTVAGSNSLEPELKEQLLVTLNNLTEAVTNIGDNLETDSDVISDKGLEEVATYYSRYCDALSSNFNRYLSAENMGRLTVPVGLILACASVGAGIGVLTPAGGMAGFGVGSLFGKLVTDQAKPKDLIKKIEDNLENQQDCN